MCGRYTLTVNPQTLMERFDLASADIAPAEPRYNIAPTQDVAVVFADSPKTLSAARWGLIPSWAKDASIGSKMINARAETLAEKPSFRSLIRRKRCLVLADSFYEWQRQADNTKIPMRILLESHAPFAFAGLYDTWKTPEGQPLRTCTIITTGANSLISPLHDRMPVILQPAQEKDWIDSSNDDPNFVQSLLQAYPPELIRMYEVSKRVNSPRNDDAGLTDAVA